MGENCIKSKEYSIQYSIDSNKYVFYQLPSAIDKTALHSFKKKKLPRKRHRTRSHMLNKYNLLKILNVVNSKQQFHFLHTGNVKFGHVF